MKNRRLGVVIGLLLMLLTLAMVSGCGAVLLNQISYQGYLTDGGGNPVTGNRAMTFRLYTTSSGGSAVWTESHGSVPVSNGLFTVALGSVTPLDEANFHQPLYLEVVVAGETLPGRQALLGAPYAFSLVPGAVVKGSINNTETYSSTLTVVNWGSGQGLSVIGTSGPALVARSASNAAILADGKFASTAPTYVWITGNSLVKNNSNDTTRWDITQNGGAMIYSGGSGTKAVYFNVTVPAVMYGQNARVTRLTVFYRTSNAANAYITSTTLYRFTTASTQALIVSDGTDRTSTTATSYSLDLTNNNVLSATQGGLGLYLNLTFADNINFVQIGGIRIDLEYQ